jgi:hypothetical protein
MGIRSQDCKRPRTLRDEEVAVIVRQSGFGYPAIARAEIFVEDEIEGGAGVHC